MERLVNSDPDNRGWKLEILISYFRVGDGSIAQNDTAAALEAYEKGLALAREIMLDAPDVVDLRASAFFQQVCKTLSGMGRVEAALMRAKEASELFRQRAARGDESESTWRLAQALSNEAWYGILGKHYDDALRAAEEAIALAPSTLEFRVNKIHALALSGATHGAKAFYVASRGPDGSNGHQLDNLLRRDLDDLSASESARQLRRISSLLDRFDPQKKEVSPQ